MFDFENFQLFLLATLLVNLAPGSDMLFVISRTLSHGTKAGYLSTFGVSIGCLFHILLASIGLSAIVIKFSAVYEIIKYAGAFYLIYLGIISMCGRKSIRVFKVLPFGEDLGGANLLWQGIWIDILNPKVAIFFLAFLPQFVNIHSENTGIQFLFLGIVFNLIGTAMFLGIVFLAGKASSFMKNSTAGKYMERISGIALISLGLNLALDEKK